MSMNPGVPRWSCEGFPRLRRLLSQPKWIVGTAVALLVAASAAKASAAPVVYRFLAAGQNGAPGIPEVQGPVVTVGGTTYGSVGHEIITSLSFTGDTADVQPWSFAGTNGYEIRKGQAAFTLFDASTAAVLASGVFDPSAGMYVSIDDGNGGVGLGSMAAWGPDNPGFPGQVVYPLGKVLATPLSYDLKSVYSTAGQLTPALSCPNFPGPCAAPVQLPLTDGHYFAISLPNGNISNTFIADVQQTTPFAGFSALTTLGANESFTVKGRFTLNKMSNGINPSLEPVTLTVNGYTVYLPGGSFTQNTTGAPYMYQGIADGNPLSVTITPLGNLSFSIVAQGSGEGVGSKPASVGLTVGGNTGTATASRD
ncbi:hypothetical protein DYQ86_18845 [Acidobacteria bacterium AB60]|nr:hypothetical protein DYQ86_18845 [Acidobacteria bacterium AB60]